MYVGRHQTFLLEQYLTRPVIYAHSIETTPQEIIDVYNLATLLDKQGWIYMRIEKGIYGIKKSGILANQELVKHIALFG